MDPSSAPPVFDNALLSQFLSFIPTLQTLAAAQQPGSTSPSFHPAVQPGVAAPIIAPSVAPTNPTPSATSAAVSNTVPSTAASSSTDPQLAFPAPIAPYSSVQMLHAVASGSSTPGHPCTTTQPGFPSISMIQWSNATCLEHASEANPRLGLPKKKKPWGKAERPLGLIKALPAPKIKNCLSVAVGDIVVVNLQVNVYPPQPPNQMINELGLPRHLHIYKRNRESFIRTLHYLNLTFAFENLPVSTSAVDLIGNIVHQLQAFGYNLPPLLASSTFAIHEQLPLQLLAYTNLGRPNSVTKTTHLVSASISSTTTLQDILANKTQFANPRLSVTSSNFFELNMVVRSSCYPLELHKSLAEVKLGHDEERRTHRCISKRVYGLFQSDIDACISEGLTVMDEEDIEYSCDEGEDDDETSEDEEHVVAQALSSVFPSASMSAIAPTSPAPSLPSSPPLPPPRSLSPSPSPPRGPDTAPPSPTQAPGALRSAAVIGGSFTTAELERNHNSRPQPLWETPWNKKRVLGLATIFSFERTHRIFEVVTETYIQNHGGTPAPTLKVAARDYGSLADGIRDTIIQCIRRRDFTLLLSADRHFILVDQSGRYVSSGSGVEREAMHTLFKRYVVDREAHFFAPLIGNYSTLSVPPGLLSRWMSEEQQLEISVLGAVVALALIYEMGPEPLNPLLLIYFINDCDVGCLTSPLVSQWFPGLHQTLLRWKSLGPGDDISEFSAHFATYHDMQVSALTGRSAEMHTALGSEMLYAAIIGKRGPQHPVFQCFRRGFSMPCDQGYNFTELARAFHGGSESFVSGVYLSQITGYDNLRLQYIFKIRSDTEDRLQSQLSIALPDHPTRASGRLSFEDFFRHFLEGVGCPSPDLMAAEEGRFSSAVNLDDMGSETFRM